MNHGPGLNFTVNSLNLQASHTLVASKSTPIYVENTPEILSLFDKYSSLDKLLRMASYCFRFINRICSKLAHTTSLILPADCHFTALLIRDAHHRTLHGGVQLTLATLRRQFWIVRGRSAVKKVIRTCITCTHHAARVPSQLMGEFPKARVHSSLPFERAGVDYAGPINVRLAKTRGKGTMKGYIAIFVCMAIRAVHIEVVEDYSSETFIAAFHRFTARRGFCK